MFCAKCGKQNENSANFCRFCGGKLIGVKELGTLEIEIKENNKTIISETIPTTQGKRFANLILDQISFYVLSFVIGLFLGMTGLYYAFGLDGVNETLLGIIITFTLYVFFEAIWSKTPGKFITKTKVVMEDGKKPEFWDIVVRTLIRFVPFEAFSFLFGSKEKSKNPRGWHDKWSKTIVIDDK